MAKLLFTKDIEGYLCYWQKGRGKCLECTADPVIDQTHHV